MDKPAPAPARLVFRASGRVVDHVGRASAGLAVLGWIAASLSWSPDQAQGASILVAIGSIALVVWGVGLVRAAVPAVITAVFTVALLLLIVFPEVHGGFGNENWASEWLMMAAPFVVLFAWRNSSRFLSAAVGALLILAAGYLVLGTSGDAWMLVAWVVVLAYCVRRRWWGAMAFVVLVPINIALLWSYLGDRIVSSVLPRAELWINTVAMWLEHPFIGHGVGSFGFEYGRFQEVHTGLFPGLDTILRPYVVEAGAAHNEVLQGLAEVGLIGMFLVGVFIWLVVRAPAMDGIAMAAKWSLLIAAPLCVVSFPLQNTATLLMMATAVGVLIPRAGPRWANAVVLLFGLFGTSAAAASENRAYAAALENRRFSADASATTDQLREGFNKLWREYQLQPWSRVVRRELALAIVAADRYGNMPPDLADKIHAIAMSAAPYSPLTLLARVEYLINSGRWVSDGREIRIHLKSLRAHAALQPFTWAVHARYSLKRGDDDGARRVLDLGLETNGREVEMKQLRILEERL